MQWGTVTWHLGWCLVFVVCALYEMKYAKRRAVPCALDSSKTHVEMGCRVSLQYMKLVPLSILVGPAMLLILPCADRWFSRLGNAIPWCLPRIRNQWQNADLCLEWTLVTAVTTCLSAVPLTVTHLVGSTSGFFMVYGMTCSVSLLTCCMACVLVQFVAIIAVTNNAFQRDGCLPNKTVLKWAWSGLVSIVFIAVTYYLFYFTSMVRDFANVSWISIARCVSLWNIHTNNDNTTDDFWPVDEYLFQDDAEMHSAALRTIRYLILEHLAFALVLRTLGYRRTDRVPRSGIEYDETTFVLKDDRASGKTSLSIPFGKRVTAAAHRGRAECLRSNLWLSRPPTGTIAEIKQELGRCLSKYGGWTRIVSSDLSSIVYEYAEPPRVLRMYSDNLAQRHQEITAGWHFVEKASSSTSSNRPYGFAQELLGTQSFVLQLYDVHGPVLFQIPVTVRTYKSSLTPNDQGTYASLVDLLYGRWVIPATVPLHNDNDEDSDDDDRHRGSPITGGSARLHDNIVWLNSIVPNCLMSYRHMEILHERNVYLPHFVCSDCNSYPRLASRLRDVNEEPYDATGNVCSVLMTFAFFYIETNHDHPPYILFPLFPQAILQHNNDVSPESGHLKKVSQFFKLAEMSDSSELVDATIVTF